MAPPGLRLCLGFVLLGCGGPRLAPPPEAASEARAPEAPSPPEERHRLQVRTTNRLTMFSRAQSIVVPDLDGHRVRMDAASWLQLRQRSDDQLLQYQVYGPLEFRRDGEPQALSPLMRGLAGHQIRTRLDTRGRVFEGPELAGSPRADRRLSAAVLALSRVMQARLPARAVPLGASWGDVIRWPTPPWEGAVIDIERRWTLVAIEGEGEGRTAQIAWDVDLRLQPFDISGVSVDGHGRLEGSSEISLRDGVTGRTALNLSFEAGPAGVSDVLSLFHIEATITDRVRPSPTASRGLVQGVRPTGSRGSHSGD